MWGGVVAPSANSISNAALQVSGENERYFFFYDVNEATIPAIRQKKSSKRLYLLTFFLGTNLTKKLKTENYR